MDYKAAMRKAMLWLCVVAVPVGAFGIWAGFNDAQLLDVVTKTFQLIFWFSAVAVGAFGVWKHCGRH